MSDQTQPLPETIQIPVRHSSLAAIEARRLKVRESQQDLKRKLSDSALERGSEKHIKLQIEGTILEREELRLDKAEIDLEISKNRTNQKSFRDASRTTSNRIISLGDELWQLRRKLKAHNESMGKAAILTPDSEGAFVSALLHLYKDPNVSKKRSSTAQSDMRKNTIAMYNALATEKDIDGGNAGPSWLQCLISGEFRPKEEIKAAHIVPASLGPELVDYIFGNGTGSRLFSADNCMMLYHGLEKAFDSGNFVIVPMDPTEKPIRRWKTVLVNQGSRNQKIGLPSLGSLGLLDEREIKFPTYHRPAARFFYYHFLVSLLRCRYYQQPGWQEVWQKLKTSQPWPTPGRYLRESMLLCLARATDSEISDDTIEKLIQEHTFSTTDRLSDDEEEEIVRRMQEIHEGKIKEQEEQEEVGIVVDGENEDQEEEAMEENEN
jgi:HNH endonuclease